MNAQLEITINRFLEQYYGNDKKQLSVQKCRWKKRMVKDPKELKGSDLTMYNLMMFASNRKEQEQESIQEQEIMKLSMEERIEKGIVPKSETVDDVEINFKKLVDDFVPKVSVWATSIRKTNRFDELLSSQKEISKKVKILVNSYLEEYEELIVEQNADPLFDELDEYLEQKLTNKIDKVFDKIESKLPLVEIRHPTTNKIIKRAYTNDEITQCMKEVVDKAEPGHEELRLHNWKKQEEAEYISRLHDNIDKHKRYIKSL